MFTSGREAKEFLVSKIVEQAQRDGTSLSEVERKMMYFSETAWAPDDYVEVNEAFERECVEWDYENKIWNLSQRFCKDARKNNRAALDAWNDAVRVLKQEDHYLLILIKKPTRVTVEEPLTWRRFLALLRMGFLIAVSLGVVWWIIVALQAWRTK